MLIALLITAAAADTTPRQLGYPVLVGVDGDQCTYQVQDMVMRDEDMVRNWLLKVPRWRIDIVFNDSSPKDCVAQAKSIAEQAAGYADIVVRYGSEADYPNLGPSPQ